jgi:hypothetical protein
MVWLAMAALADPLACPAGKAWVPAHCARGDVIVPEASPGVCAAGDTSVAAGCSVVAVMSRFVDVHAEPPAKWHGAHASQAASAVVLGWIPMADIDAAFATAAPALDTCWTSDGEDGPFGEIVVKVSVGTDGAVTAATVQSSTLGAPAVDACAEGVATGLKLPAEAQGVTIVTYPLWYAP